MNMALKHEINTVTNIILKIEDGTPAELPIELVYQLDYSSALI